AAALPADAAPAAALPADAAPAAALPADAAPAAALPADAAPAAALPADAAPAPASRIDALHALLAPYAERHVVVFLPGYFGPVAEPLGLLELLRGDAEGGRLRLRQARQAAETAGATVAAARIAALLDA
ncbi:hypothetical protein Q7L71_27940, partial [Conexibacter sp. CPCC 205706]